MQTNDKKKSYFTKTEIVLYLFSVIAIVVFYCIFDRENLLRLFASIVGVSALIINAKGNPLGQLLMVIFSIMYGIISYNFAYYGEMITYLGMSAPIALVAMIFWLKNPYKGNRSQVRINTIHKKEIILIIIITFIVTVGFYFVLKALNTANLLPSTLSVTTSFLAAYLTFRRSEYYALAYALNDIVLIILWIMATIEYIGYISVVVCFVIFLINDLYGYFNWLKMKKKQAQNSCEEIIEQDKKD